MPPRIGAPRRVGPRLVERVLMLLVHGRRVVRGGIFTKYRGLPNEGGHLEPEVFLAALLIFVGIPALTVIKLARLRAARPQSLPADVTARLEGLERGLQELQQELAETQE